MKNLEAHVFLAINDFWRSTPCLLWRIRTCPTDLCLFVNGLKRYWEEI